MTVNVEHGQDVQNSHHNWFHLSSSVLEDMHVLEEAVSFVGYDHGIANWQLVFVTDPERKRRMLSAYPDIHADMVAVLCVNPEAWFVSRSDLWENAGFDARSRFMDDMLAIGRGDKNLQRDRAMRSVGMAAGALVSKAKSLGYIIENLHDTDLGMIGREIGLPASHHVEYVFSLGHHSNRSGHGEIAQRGRKCVAREQFCHKSGD
ncbi:MAG: hypothetical protein RBR86_02245 [Pseudobdellovibrionaceae bacterium]|jgi:hypothetical protein|nr:hypothetical protein [Pseudobdellovibrionaceae bacterium]